MLRVLHQRALAGAELPPDAGEDRLGEQLWLFLFQRGEDFEHRVGVTRLRQRPIDRAQPPDGAPQSSSAIGVHQVDDGADFLHALPGFVNRVVAGRVTLTQRVGGGLQFLAGETAQAVGNRFVEA